MNKLMARIVAVVMAVMMLGTVSFAANLNAENNEIPAEAVTGNYGDLWTVRAVAENGTVVAMYQGGEPGDIAIDPTKLGDSDYVNVTYSGKGATEATTVKVGVNKQAVAQNIKVKDMIEVEGVTYTRVAYVQSTFNLAGKTVSKFGYILKDLAANGTPNEVAYTGEISGAATVDFDVLITGVPVGADIVADSFINYVAE